jgi:hypothetical protein
LGLEIQNRFLTLHLKNTLSLITHPRTVAWGLNWFSGNSKQMQSAQDVKLWKMAYTCINAEGRMLMRSGIRICKNWQSTCPSRKLTPNFKMLFSWVCHAGGKVNGSFRHGGTTHQSIHHNLPPKFGLSLDSNTPLDGITCSKVFKAYYGKKDSNNTMMNTASTSPADNGYKESSLDWQDKVEDHEFTETTRNCWNTGL